MAQFNSNWEECKLKKIVVRVPQFGAPSVEAEGFEGVGCQDATAVIEAALCTKGEATVEKKPEWNNTSEEETQQVTW